MVSFVYFVKVVLLLLSNLLVFSFYQQLNHLLIFYLLLIDIFYLILTLIFYFLNHSFLIYNYKLISLKLILIYSYYLPFLLFLRNIHYYPILIIIHELLNFKHTILKSLFFQPIFLNLSSTFYHGIF